MLVARYTQRVCAMLPFVDWCRLLVGCFVCWMCCVSVYIVVRCLFSVVCRCVSLVVGRCWSLMIGACCLLVYARCSELLLIYCIWSGSLRAGCFLLFVV